MYTNSKVTPLGNITKSHNLRGHDANYIMPLMPTLVFYCVPHTVEIKLVKTRGIAEPHAWWVSHTALTCNGL